MLGMNAWFLATLLAGAMWWVAVAARPSWSALPAEAAARAYTAAFSRGGPALAALAASSAGLAVAAAAREGEALWAVGGGLIVAALGLTVAAMRRHGHRLRDGDPDAHAVLRSWARLHWIRTGLVSAAVLVFIVAAH